MEHQGSAQDLVHVTWSLPRGYRSATQTRRQMAQRVSWHQSGSPRSQQGPYHTKSIWEWLYLLWGPSKNWHQKALSQGRLCAWHMVPPPVLTKSPAAPDYSFVSLPFWGGQRPPTCPWGAWKVRLPTLGQMPPGPVPPSGPTLALAEGGAYL